MGNECEAPRGSARVRCRRGRAGGAALAARAALTNVPGPYDWSASPPRGSRDTFVEWMAKNRGENPRFLAERFDRFRELVARHDVWDETDMRA
jgi:protein-L-isoaspartate(D-aspartate) O-methyltransferase